MFRFTLRELALSTIIVAMGFAWWCDRWLAETAVKDFHERGRQQLLEKLRSEIQRVADESGVAIEVEAAGMTITGRPELRILQ